MTSTIPRLRHLNPVDLLPPTKDAFRADVVGGLHEADGSLDVIAKITRLSEAVAAADQCLVFVRDQSRMVAVDPDDGGRGAACPPLVVSDSWLRQLSNGRPVVIDDVGDLAGDPAERRPRPHLAALVLVPLVAEGFVEGMVVVAWTRQAEICSTLLTRLSLLARWGGLALNNAKWERIIAFAVAEDG